MPGRLCSDRRQAYNGGVVIVDRTSLTAGIANNLRGLPILSRFGTRRPLTAVNAVVLHQMGFDRGDRPDQYDTVIAHFAVLRDGTVLQLRPIEALLNDAHARASLHIEFASFGAEGLATSEEIADGTAGSRVPTWAEVEAGRQLVRHLWSRHALRYVYAHRQFNLHGRPNCPGPHIWYNVGHWAAVSLGLSSEGAPRAIPDAWLDPAARV